MNTIETFIDEAQEIKTKLLPLCKEAFGATLADDWNNHDIAPVFWKNVLQKKIDKDGVYCANLWLYIPSFDDGRKTGSTPSPENWVLVSLKDALNKWIVALEEKTKDRQQTVAKADFYTSLRQELIGLGQRLLVNV